MFNTFLTISSFIICCVALGINHFVVGRLLRQNKELLEENEFELKYNKYIISRYERVYEEKRKLELQNKRLREQVEFLKRELLGEKFDSNALPDLPMDVIEQIRKRAFDIYCGAYKDKNDN